MRNADQVVGPREKRKEESRPADSELLILNEQSEIPT